MHRHLIEKYKSEFENRPDTWRSFGADLVDAGSPNPCNRSSMARKTLCGRWQEAWKEWLAAGEFSQDDEEIMPAFILAAEAIFHRRAPAPVLENLPRRIWKEAYYLKKVGQFKKDIKFWNLMHSHLMKKGTNPSNPFYIGRNKLGQLLLDGKIKEAEAYYREINYDQELMAETWLALIHTTAHALGIKEEKKLSETRMWFFIDQNDRPRGPILENSLKNLFDQNRLWPDTPVWTQGMRDWASAATTKRFRQGPAYTGPLPPPVA